MRNGLNVSSLNEVGIVVRCVETFSVKCGARRLDLLREPREVRDFTGLRFSTGDGIRYRQTTVGLNFVHIIPVHPTLTPLSLANILVVRPFSLLSSLEGLTPPLSRVDVWVTHSWMFEREGSDTDDPRWVSPITSSAERDDKDLPGPRVGDRVVQLLTEDV